MARTYTTVSGDMWDYIAFKAMGSEMHMDALMAANMNYRETAVFSAGVVLNIPKKKVAKLVSLPPWKR